MTDEDILTRARARAVDANQPYAGALLPAEAWQLMQSAGAKLVDVRTRAEWEWVGRIPGSVEIEWNTWPGGMRNEQFLAQLKSQVPTSTPVLFVCRSGARSNQAAIAAAGEGYQAFNVLEGFEGDKDQAGHRQTVGGWKVAGLPWTQG
jgi:rhodanese-related sulfurtransferase